VLVRAAEDYEVANPNGAVFRNYVAISGSASDKGDVDLGVPQFCDLSSTRPATGMAEAVFGERVVSARQLCKRYAPFMTIAPYRNNALDSPNEAFGVKFQAPMYPSAPTLNPVINPWATSTYSLPTCMFNAVSWYTVPFIGIKGSMKHKMVYYYNYGAGQASVAAFVGTSPGVGGTGAIVVPKGIYKNAGTAGSGLTPFDMLAFLSHATDGMEFSGFTQGNLVLAEGEIPPDHGQLWVYINTSDVDLGPPGPEYTVFSTSGNPAKNFAVCLCAAADDTQPVFFVGTAIITGATSSVEWQNSLLA